MPGDPHPAIIYTPFAFDSVLDEFQIPIQNRGLSVAQNVVYRRLGGYGKRTGTAPYANAASSGLTLPVSSGVRWYRGRPSTFKQMVVQSGDALYKGNDITGAFTSISSLTASSTPAFFASAFDPAESGVGGTPASDVLVVAYGSGVPKKYDGTNFVNLSSSITQNFTGVAFFHEHLWFWGDPNNPDTVYATDLGNPEGFTFMNSFGGYQVGRGDGDPLVQCMVAAGPYIYALKSNSVYGFTGYDFALGDYQFQLSPQVLGVGTTAPHSVQVLSNQFLIWWSGADFFMLPVGSQQAIRIGTPIVNTITQAAKGSQTSIRSFCGDLLVQTATGFALYTNMYLCAIDASGSGKNDTILVYDADVSNLRGKPAWTVWKGLNVGAFIPWGVNQGDQPVLYYGDSVASQVSLIGGDQTADVTGAGLRVPIQVKLVTGRNGAGQPDRKKRLDRVYLDVEANPGTFNITVDSDQQTSATVPVTSVGRVGGQWGQTWGSFNWGAAGGLLYQSLQAAYQKTVVGYNYTVTINEASASSSYEVVALSYRSLLEAYRP